MSDRPATATHPPARFVFGFVFRHFKPIRGFVS